MARNVESAVSDNDYNDQVAALTLEQDGPIQQWGCWSWLLDLISMLDAESTHSCPQLASVKVPGHQSGPIYPWTGEKLPSIFLLGKGIKADFLFAPHSI